MVVGVEELRELEGDDRGGLIVWTDAGWWVAAEIREVIDDGDPEYDDLSGWDDSRVRLHMYAPAARDGWAAGEAALVCESDEGEWGDVRLAYHTTPLDDGTESYGETDESVRLSRVEPISWSIVHDRRTKVIEEMERALASGVSTGTYTRALLAASVVRAAARTGWGDVWGAYELEADVASLTGFAEWLDGPAFRKLLDGVGREMWPSRCDAWAVSDRVLLRSLTVIQYFATDWGYVVEPSTDGDDEEDDVVESAGGEGVEDADDEVGEVTFEPADEE